MRTSNNALEQLVSQFTRESCDFLDVYLKAGGKYLEYMESIGVKAKTIDGYIALQFRNWLEELDGVLILFSSNSIKNTFSLTRNMLDIFIQFRYFFSDYSTMEQKMWCYLIVSQYKQIQLLKKYISIAKKTKEKDLLIESQEKYKYAQKEYESLDFGEDGDKYKNAIEKVLGRKDWYKIYNPDIKNMRELMLKMGGNDQDKFKVMYDLTYGQLSCHIHGFKNDNDFYLDKGKMKFAPFRSVLGGSYIPSVINPMFGSIIETLKTYYGKQIDFDKLLNNTTLRKQSTLLAHIENLDGLILQEKINEAYKGNII